MSHAEKQGTLKAIEDEKKFREAVLLVLLDKLGLSPVHTHGSQERGKDIVCKHDNPFGVTEWIAVVAKVGKITGSTSGTGGFQTVLNQVEEAFGYAYKDPSSKKLVSINKVIVVTNDEITDPAKEKIVDKLGKPGAKDANVHFIDGHRLAGLIDDHWPDFWRNVTDLLTDEDRMTEDAGLVLYVLARAHYLSKAEKKKKKVEREMTKERIQRQTGLPGDKVETALTYLLQAEYVEQLRKKTYALHSKKTVGTLLMNSDQIRLLFAIKAIVGDDNRFTLESVLEESKKEILSFAKGFVTKTLDDLRQGGYIEKDEARGSGNFKLDIDMVEEERPYLDRQLKYLGRIPTHVN